ncbi:restriction endonuclease [Sutterella faecalis]|uniref:Restriction endonuclease n=1 Tax=Sutterella faecalis TaxID=2584944 RepID=A0ABX5VMG6_9BURK|nr:type I restriction endonuclease [Sutterella faecalis]QDA55684.1 restriction endonuclease [Sutterella faecalis]
MDFIDEIKILGGRSKNLASNLLTEEATKTSLILPFIQLLGFDIFNPTEVVPEYQAEAGVKKDQRVDYALQKNNKPIILIEAKSYSTELGPEHEDQLRRYFPFVKSASIGILTNGHKYKFFTDLEARNMMDEKPYMEFDIENPSLDLIPKIQELRKDRFDDEKAVRIAEQLKYTGQFKQLLAKQLDAPDEDFVRFFASQVWSGKINQSAKDKLTPLLKDAFKQFIEDRIAARLKKAAEDEEAEKKPITDAETPTAESSVVADDSDDGVVTTDDEKLGYSIIQAVSAAVIDPSRIFIRDNKSYCAILLDNSRKKTIVRLYFKKDSLKVDFQGVKKDDPMVELEKVSDLYSYSDDIVSIISGYLNKNTKEAKDEKEAIEEIAE